MTAPGLLSAASGAQSQQALDQLLVTTVIGAEPEAELATAACDPSHHIYKGKAADCPACLCSTAQGAAGSASAIFVRFGYCVPAQADARVIPGTYPQYIASPELRVATYAHRSEVAPQLRQVPPQKIRCFLPAGFVARPVHCVQPLSGLGQRKNRRMVREGLLPAMVRPLLTVPVSF